MTMRILPIFSSPRPLRTFGLGLIAMMVVATPRLLAEEIPPQIDFEGMDVELPDFGAVLQPLGGEAEFRPAARWSDPFQFTVSQDQPHEGKESLLWEFSEDSGGMANLRFPIIALPAGTSKAQIRFFVRTENIESSGILAVGQMDEQGAHLKTLYDVAQIPSSSQWAQVEWEGELEPGTAGLRVTVVYKDAPASAKIWLDDLSVIPK